MFDDMPNDIAAEYVLGTLQGKARLQFERLLYEDAGMRQRVREWEERLFVLADGIRPVRPRPRVWENIHRRINPEVSRSQPAVAKWWKVWGVAASVMLIILGAYLIRNLPSTPVVLPTLAVLNNKAAETGWLVQASYDKRIMTIQALSVSHPGKGKSYELWMLPQGSAPVSLGLLPLSGKRYLSLGAEQLALLRRSAALAVSLEPQGGSPTGAPTGPVNYQGRILKI